ncbi:MAG: protein translocase subunit SecD [Phycisphaerales bacterium JB065]
MQNLIRNTILTAVLLVLCGLAIYPPAEKLRLGKDLAGGVSLTYSILLSDDDSASVVDEMISVLRERVNPQGLFEISFVQQGRDRLVVSMPLPTPEVKALGDEYRKELESFSEFTIDASALQRAIRRTGEDRIQALQALADSAPRQQILAPVIEAAQAIDEAQRVYDEAAAASESGEPDLAVVEQLVDARLALDAARDRAIDLSVSPNELRIAMQLSDAKPQIRDAEPDAPELISERERALRSIRDRLSQIDGGIERLEGLLEKLSAYQAKQRGLDDPADLQRMLAGAGVLEFRIAITPGEIGDIENTLREDLQRRGPNAASTDRYRWYEIEKLESFAGEIDQYRSAVANPSAYFASQAGGGLIVEERGGRYYMLLYNTPNKRLTPLEGDWSVASSAPTRDENGLPAIGFRMDTRGAQLLGNLTEENVGKKMAVLLDDKVYTAPNLITRISRQGQITGRFTQSEIQYIVRTLSAGSLSAKLAPEPLSINTIAPELGKDNLDKGLAASWIALIAVGVFMIVYYFFHGVIAMLALAANAVIILGIMSLARASFTLPGIAGIVLTFGMAVDANVLIYERIREELLAGNDLKTAVRLAYQKVLSTIVDANVTNLIVCFVLAYTATEEVKGFAITLGIGVVATMFSSLFISRIIYSWLIDRFGITQMRQLPMLVPALQKSFEPKINWIKLRPLFIIISACFIGLGVSMIVVQGEEMLDTEFRGGTVATLQFRNDDQTGQPMTLERGEVEDRVHAIGAEAPADSPLRALENADIVALNSDDGLSASTFQIKTTISDTDDGADSLQNQLTNTFGDVIDSQPALSFRGSDIEDPALAPIIKIFDDQLGPINGVDYGNDVEEFIGGAAFVLSDIQPRVSEQSLNDRLLLFRNKPENSWALNRQFELVVLEGTAQEVETAVVLVRDESIDFESERIWNRDIAEREWNLIRESLTNATSLISTQSFSPEIASSFRAQAIVAVLLSFLLIIIYIWARFGSVRYSLAAVTALMHDVIIAIGLIAFAEILYANVPFLVSLGLQPYKIDLALVAAILTIVGYSLNDTIVILDRIRENRGKLAYASAVIVNRSINQTLSRTIITSGTTLIALVVLFSSGGDALSSFTYALMCGVIVGTYSSIAVAAPLVFTKRIPESARKFVRQTEERLLEEADHNPQT